MKIVCAQLFRVCFMKRRPKFFGSINGENSYKEIDTQIHLFNSNHIVTKSSNNDNYHSKSDLCKHLAKINVNKFELYDRRK